MNDQHPPLIPLPFSIIDSHSRLKRKTTKTLTKFFKNLIYNSTVPLSSEAYREDIYSIPHVRDHHDSNLYYLDTHPLVETPDEPSFSNPFTSPLNSNETLR